RHGVVDPGDLARDLRLTMLVWLLWIAVASVMFFLRSRSPVTRAHRGRLTQTRGAAFTRRPAAGGSVRDPAVPPTGARHCGRTVSNDPQEVARNRAASRRFPHRAGARRRTERCQAPVPDRHAMRAEV